MALDLNLLGEPSIPFPTDTPPKASLIVSNPEAYATQLAETLTGGPLIREGYSPAYDALLKVAPPAALTPEGVAKAHKEVGWGDRGMGEWGW